MTDFVIGQRWISNTEAELGLGIVSDLEARHITVSFPAAGEQRVYAITNAPLTRVQYRIGDLINNSDNDSLKIEEVENRNGYLVYHGLDGSGEDASWAEVELNCFVYFSQPQDRLFAGQVDKLSEFELRYQTLQQQHRLAQLPSRGLMGPRVELLPHQLYIANEVGQRFAPRVLLADEVGLGKTIEAGLIIHRQLHTGLSQRVLIAVPDSLKHQWLVEMLRRFNLQFTLLDEARCKAIEETSADEALNDEVLDDPFDELLETHNPFESAQLILCSLDLLQGKRLEQAMDSRWDLLVVDEAHHLEWSPEEASPAYSAIEQLAEMARGLLLLTATPEQLGITSHFARLRLLDPDRYYDLPRFLEEQENYQPVNELVQSLLQEDSQSQLLNNSNLAATVADKLGNDALSKLQTAESEETYLQTREQVITQLLDQHGTGRVLFRNTRSGVKGFPERQLFTYPLPSSSVSACDAITDDNVHEHPKAEWLFNWLKKNKREKLLVICHDADTALILETYLRLRKGILSAAFHEGLSLLERDRAAAYFADGEDGAQVLLCSEIGSEGRNFQFAHNLVMLDLPDNPDLLEQRIGRLDRIGQQETVKIHVPYAEQDIDGNPSRESLWLTWLHEGLHCFERVCPIGSAVYSEFSEELEPLLSAHDDVDAFDDLLERTRAFGDQLLNDLQRGRDRLLELNSCKPEIAAPIVENLQQENETDDLRTYLDNAFDTFGVDQEKHSEHAQVLRPSDHMQCHSFPNLPEEGMTATFDRRDALSREDLHFLTWEHPMTIGVMDMILSGDKGNTSICTLKLPPLKPGTLMVEALLRPNCPAPKVLQLQRYMSEGCIRVLLDQDGKDLGKIIQPAHIQKLAQRVKKPTARQLINHARPQIEKLLDTIVNQGNAQEASLVQAAIDQMDNEYDQEIVRLEQLAEHNPNIRPEEIEYLRGKQQIAAEYLQQTRLQLDAVRVIVVT